jgi:hypothetical protein
MCPGVLVFGVCANNLCIYLIAVTYRAPDYITQNILHLKFLEI